MSSMVAMKRGFVATFVACALGTLILLLVAYSQPSLHLRDRYLADYSGAAAVRQIFDNTATQVSAITSINSTFQKPDAAKTNATFSVDFMLANQSAALENFAFYLQENFSRYASASIIPDFSQVAGTKFELSSNTTSFFVDYGSRSAGLEPVGSATETGITNLTILFTTNETINETTAWSFDAGGDVLVNFYFVHANGTISSSGLMDSSTPHNYWLNVSTGAGGGENVRVYFGNVGSNHGVFRFNSTAINGKLITSATMPYSGASAWYYNATLNITKGAIYRYSKLFAWEGG
ncbi:MAG: hypothetical protein WC408_06905 [Candidatus Micrarchaeia archaeon]|jgi:hypothetical protein